VGRIAKILQFVRVVRNDIASSKVSDVTVDVGGGTNVSAENFAGAGDDSYPLLTDYALIVPVPSDRDACIGYVDTKNTPKALEGDKRIYSRDPGTGNVIAEVWLKADGTIIGVNTNGQFVLQAGGDFVINGLTIDVNGNINTTGTIDSGDITSTGTVEGDTVKGNTSLLAGSAEVVAHVHGGVTAGSVNTAALL